jgi:transcriptional regulator with XRE-family HTH domain
VAERRDLASELQHQMAQVRMGASELETLTGLKRATIYYILNGKTLAPKPETLAKIARALATDPVNSSRFDRSRLGLIFRSLMSASGQSIERIFASKDIFDESGERKVIRRHTPILNVPGVGMIEDVETERRGMRVLEHSTELSDLAQGLHEAIENGRVGDTFREILMVKGILRSILDAIDPDYDYHEPSEAISESDAALDQELRQDEDEHRRRSRARSQLRQP